MSGISYQIQRKVRGKWELYTFIFDDEKSANEKLTWCNEYKSAYQWRIVKVSYGR